MVNIEQAISNVEGQARVFVVTLKPCPPREIGAAGISRGKSVSKNKETMFISVHPMR
jgi:hypothetical protein